MELGILKLIVIFVTFHLVEIVTGRDAPPIMIPDQGTVIGTYLKMYRTQNVLAYLGIPYALPPTNERRFAPPVVDDIPSWEGVRNATFFQPDCWQNPNQPLKKHDDLFLKLLRAARPTPASDEPKRYDEDCLFVNLFIPDSPAPMEGYAVIAWLHTGDFSYGSASELDPFQMVFKQKVIVVTIAYRLNLFGFLTTLDGESPGNFGLMDQSAGLLWIKRNIKLFGGNENSITLMGHGAGAISVGLHLTSGDWTEGLFHKAVIMSGSPLAENAVREPSAFDKTLDDVSTSFGCIRKPTSKLMECLRHINAQILSENLPNIEWGPIVDEGLSNTTTPFIPDFPRELIEKGNLRKVPLLIGFTDMEEVLDVIIGEMMETGISPEMYDTLLSDVILTDLSHLESNETWCGNVAIVIDAVGYAYKPYPPITDAMRLRKMFVDFSTERNYIAPSLFLASFMSKHTTTYAYRFDIKARTGFSREDIAEWVGVPHNFELIFIWGMPYWTNQDMINIWDSTDKRVSDIIMTLWANFAKFADPTKAGVYIKWETFTANQPRILVIDRAFNMTDEMNFRAIQFWNDYYPKAVQHAAGCCNATNVAAEITTDNGSYFTIFLAFISLSVILLNRDLKLLT